MINVTLRESNKTTNLSDKTISPIEISEQLDASLDSGTLNYRAREADKKGLNETLARYVVGIADTTFDFVGTDSRALLRRETPTECIYSHKVSLVEPSKILQGVLIDGFGLSQPEDYESRKTLYDVVVRLLRITPFDNAQSSSSKFILTNNNDIIDVLKSVKSPEFKWNTQTTLWECLLQLGAVIDAMPRLVADSSGKYRVVTFDFINAYTDEVTSLYDGNNVIAVGESVDEIQYNSALSAIVENLREK